MNRREAAAWPARRPKATSARLVRRLRRTRSGARRDHRGRRAGRRLRSHRGIVSLVPPAPRRIADVTGAGDALAGAAVAALMPACRSARRCARASPPRCLPSNAGRACRTSRRRTLRKRWPWCRSPKSMPRRKPKDDPGRGAGPSSISIRPVAAALAAGRPVVALESTIITHGMPFPQTAPWPAASRRSSRRKARRRQRSPCIDGRLQDRPSAQTSARQLAQESGAMKLSRADLAFALSPSAAPAAPRSRPP